MSKLQLAGFRGRAQHPNNDADSHFQGNRLTCSDSLQLLDLAGGVIGLQHSVEIVSPGIFFPVSFALLECLDRYHVAILVLQSVVEGRTANAPINRTWSLRWNS